MSLQGKTLFVTGASRGIGHAIFEKPSREFTGNFLIDDSFLYEEGVRDFDKYKVDPTARLMPDFFVPESSKPPPGVVVG